MPKAGNRASKDFVNKNFDREDKTWVTVNEKASPGSKRLSFSLVNFLPSWVRVGV